MRITRLSGLGKSTLACTLECCLMPKGKFRYVLDGGQHAPLLDHNLGFSIVDWRENIRCVTKVVVLFANVWFIIIINFIHQYKRYRAFPKPSLNTTSLWRCTWKCLCMCCEGRDYKSFYNLSRMGVLKGFIRINDL